MSSNAHMSSNACGDKLSWVTFPSSYLSPLNLQDCTILTT